MRYSFQAFPGAFLFCLAAFLFACEKEGELPEAPKDEERASGGKAEHSSSDAPSEKADAPGGGMKLCSCPGFTLVQEGGSYDCPPGEGCTKVMPCPCPNSASRPVLNTKEEQEALFALDDAIDEGSVDAFFSNGPWMKAFPFLQEREDLLEGLQEGRLTMLKLHPEEAGPVHYGVVAASTDGLSDPDEARFAVQVPKRSYER